MITMNVDTVLNDFTWVIKILESSESKEHIQTSLNCFNLWENKHVDSKLSTKEKKIISDLKSRFWDKFKNKVSNIGTFNI